MYLFSLKHVATQGLDDLAQNIVQLAKTGAPDETMTSAIESIRAIVARHQGAIELLFWRVAGSFLLLVVMPLLLVASCS